MNRQDPIDGFVLWFVVRLLLAALVFVVIGFVAGTAFAGVVTACTHDATPPTPLVLDKEQEARVEVFKEKQEARDELCDAIPVLRVLPYALRFQRGQWDFRFYLFLKGDFKWSS